MSLTVKEQKGGNIYEAHRQWASRPPDQCFESLQDLHNFCSSYRSRSEVISAELSTMRIGPHYRHSDDLVIAGPGADLGHGFEFTNFSFGQLCSNIQCPPDFISTLPSEMAAEVMNYKLEQFEKDGGKQALLLVQHEKDSTTGDKTILKATTSKVYDRVWNAQVTRFLLVVNDHFGGRFKPPVENWKGESELLGGTGLYASDRDMFAFLIDEQKSLDVKGSELVRGFFIKNNEVGTGSLSICMFLCDFVCGNHIIWNVNQAIQVSARHSGRAATETFEKVFPMAIAIQVASKASLDEDRIKLAQDKILGPNKEKVTDYLFGKRLATRKLANAAWEYSDMRDGMNPNSVWGMVSGLTAMARNVSHYDKREVIEISATKLMEEVAA